MCNADRKCANASGPPKEYRGRSVLYITRANDSAIVRACAFRGKAGPFRVAYSNPNPPFLFFDKRRARWPMPTPGPGVSDNPRVGGYPGSGVPWGCLGEGWGWLDLAGSEPGHPRRGPFLIRAFGVFHGPWRGTEYADRDDQRSKTRTPDAPERNAGPVAPPFGPPRPSGISP